MALHFYLILFKDTNNNRIQIQIPCIVLCCVIEKTSSLNNEHEQPLALKFSETERPAERTQKKESEKCLCGNTFGKQINNK